MKRVKDLYPKIYDQKNIELADEKARKCKRNRYGVRKHDEHREIDNYALYLALREEDYHTSEYTTYKIYEPKERLIFRLPYYPDRITHHAIMNVMEPSGLRYSLEILTPVLREEVFIVSCKVI